MTPVDIVNKLSLGHIPLEKRHSSVASIASLILLKSKSFPTVSLSQDGTSLPQLFLRRKHTSSPQPFKKLLLVLLLCTNI
jgi:hypothetical protein